MTTNLGADPDSLPVVTEELPVYDQANLQLALEAWADGDGRSLTASGFAMGGNRFMGIELADLLMRRRPPGWTAELASVRFADVPLPDGQRRLCYETALLSLTDRDRSLVALVSRAPQHRPGTPPLSVQVTAVERQHAVDFLAEVRELRHRLNVYRGRVLAVAQGDQHNPFSDDLQLVLVEPPAHGRDDVVLPDGLLELVERHTIGFADNVERLRAAGQSLHRGVLLYGPPGTGKTHLVRYLATAMAGRTTFIVSGAALGVLAPICQLARDLAPAMVVLEDVDLVAAERSTPRRGPNPLLFTLMNEMDGIGSDADIVFLLTTNRADLLEPALAARPGRVDLAVEIPPPDAECRRRLVRLYGVSLGLGATDVDRVVERTAGVSAAFINELLRRAALIAVTSADAPAGVHVDGAHLDRALDEMLDRAGALSRTLLGAPPP